MYLTGLIHRERLFELATRWFCDRMEPNDGRFATKVFIYESFVTGPFVQRLLMDVAGRVQPGDLYARRVTTKDEVRDAIIAGTPHPDERARMLFQRYRDCPEEFFPGTPTDLVVAKRADGRLFGMARFKSPRRMAEKAARRVADRLEGHICDCARLFARRRAESAGVSLEHFYSSAESMADDFVAAERAVSLEFREGKVVFSPRDLRVDDVVGFKFVDNEDNLRRIEQAIREHPFVMAVEREEHRGVYNDINLLVDLALPEPGIIIDGLRGQDWSSAAGRGLHPETLARELPEYVESGARTFRTEVILTTPEELIESEFGRSIHEERIIAQRHKTSYTGRIAQNASYIIEYLLRMAASPTVDIAALPVKMWGRYLPDTVAQAVAALYGVTSGAQTMGAFVTGPETFYPHIDTPTDELRVVNG